MSVVRWWVVHPVVGFKGVGAGVPLVYECCKMVSGTSCGLVIGGGGQWVL